MGTLSYFYKIKCFARSRFYSQYIQMTAKQILSIIDSGFNVGYEQDTK